MKKVVILGAGQAGQAVLGLLNPGVMLVTAFADNNPDIHRSGEIPVLPVAEALSSNPDIVIISVLGPERNAQLRAQVCSLGYSGEVLSFRDIDDCFDIRGATLMRIAERIKEDGIDGCVAELGVYRGEFSRRINQLFPDRKLYLFDTFEGFDARDIEAERHISANMMTRDFSETSTEDVYLRMPHKEQIILKKGFFPETADGLEEIFVLVSIDADLYAPTLAGLDYFYPRLEHGGVILLHDYNSGQFKGVKKAVESYETVHGPLPLVPLCDVHGTAVIIKS